MITLGDLAALGRQPYYGPGTTGKTDTPQPPRSVRVTPATGGYRYSGQGDHETEAEFFERMRQAQDAERMRRATGRHAPAPGVWSWPVNTDDADPAQGNLAPCSGCGQPVVPGATFCPSCGLRYGTGTPGTFASVRPGALFYASQARPSYQVRQATPVRQAQQYRMPTYLTPSQRTATAAYYGGAQTYGRLGNMPMGMPTSSSLPQVPGLPSMRIRIGDGDYGTKQTLENMGKLAVEASRDPRWIDYARSVISGLPNKDYEGEAQRFFDHVVTTIRYTKDPTGMELIQDPRWTQFVWGQGDCDDHATMLAALALSVGLGAAFRTVGVDVQGIPPEQSPWSHVYAVVGVPEGNRVSWIGADTTQPGGYLGWEPRNVARVGTWVISQPG